MRHRPLLFLLLAAAACERRAPSGARFAIRAPDRLRAALTAADLCGHLDVRLTLARENNFAAPAIDDVPLQAQGNCTWKLAQERQVVGGTYSLFVRFWAPPSLTGGSAPLLLAMYVRRSFSIPGEVAPLGAEDFLSAPQDAADARLAGLEVSFDADGDSRSNLGEVLDGTNPFHADTIPQPKLEGAPPGTPAKEGVAFEVTLRSEDGNDVPHQTRISVRHQNGAAYAPQEITFTAATDHGSPIVAPDPSQRAWNEQWNLTAGADLDARAGAGIWKVTITPDEPFVGGLVLQVSTLDGSGAVLATTAPVEVPVALDPSLDAPVVLPDGRGPPASSLTFAEQGSPADARRFTVADRNLGSPSSAYTIELKAGAPAGLELSRDNVQSVLTWSPTNDQARASPLQAELELYDGGHNLKGTVSIPLVVGPLLNDPPSIVPPDAQYRALPKPGSAQAAKIVLPFFVQDVDGVDSPPSCTASAAGNACSGGAAFASAACAVSGARSGDRWPMSLTLVPGPGYGTCAGDASANPPVAPYTATVAATDAAPAGARNGALTANAVFELRMAEQMVVSSLSGLPAGTFTGFIDGTLKGTNPTGGRAIVAGDRSFALVDLGTTTRGVVKTYAATEACLSGWFETPPYQSGTVDLVHHRAALLGPFLPSKYGCGDNGLVVFDLQSGAVSSTPIDTACAGVISPNFSNPVADPRTGDVYFLCIGSSSSKLVQVDASGALQSKTIAASLEPYHASHAAAVPVGGKTWLVAAAVNDGFVAFDLSTFSSASLSSVNVGGPGNYSRAADERVVDVERGSYLYVYEDNGGGHGVLGKIDFGPAVRLQTLPLGATKYNYAHAIALRRPFSTPPTPSPQLVATLGNDGATEFADALWVDLGTWSVARQSSTQPYTVHFDRFWPTPDRRYYLRVVSPYPTTRLVLHPWNGGAVISVDEPALETHNLIDVASSAEGSVALVAMGDSTALVLEFPEAAQGVDQ